MPEKSGLQSYERAFCHLDPKSKRNPFHSQKTEKQLTIESLRTVSQNSRKISIRYSTSPLDVSTIMTIESVGLIAPEFQIQVHEFHLHDAYKISISSIRYLGSGLGKSQPFYMLGKRAARR